MNQPHPLPNKVAMMTLRRLIRAGLFAALLVLLPQGHALAQMGLGKPSQKPDDPLISADIGFGGRVWPNRWIPLTITLTGGTKAFEGAVTISYPQDDHTGTQIIRSVAATPGKTASFGTLVNLPSSTSQVLLTLRAKNGRVVRRVTLATLPDPSRGDVFLPPPIADTPIVLALGMPSDPALGTVRTLQDDDTDRHAIGLARPDIAFLPPTELPSSWAALDSVLMAVTTGDGSRGCDPRTLSAIREWVSSGGRLVILANRPGEAWRDWFSGSPEQPAPITIASARSTPVPADLAEALAFQPPVVVKSTPRTWNSNVVPPPPAAGPAPAPAAPQRDDRFTAAASIAGRPIFLTPEGVRLGWTIRAEIEGDAQQGLIAEGPLGFGWVVVVGFDPQIVASSVRDDATARVWSDLLATALGDWRERKTSGMGVPVPTSQDQFSGGSLTVPDYPAQLARNAVLDKISDVPTVGYSVFPILAVGIFVLALLMGPVDAVVLKKLGARHRSWATAIGWIALAGVAAYFIPTMARSGNTRLNRFSIVDARQTTADPSSPAPAWRTAVTGVFAGSSMDKAFKGPLDGSWWKPASSAPEYYWGNQQQMSPRQSVTARQSLPDLTTLSRTDDPWGGFGVGPSDGVGGNIPDHVRFKIWTFRTFQDQSRASTPLRAIIRRDSTGASPAWSVELRGVPEGARVVGAALRAPDDPGHEWHSLSLEDRDGALAATTTGRGSLLPTGVWAPLDPVQDANYPYAPYGQPRQLRAALPLMLPGPDRREWGIAQSLKQSCAVLYLILSNMPPDVTLDAETDYRHTQICRLVVPIATDNQPSPPEPEGEAK